MITIEDKIKFFEKVVNEKIEQQNIKELESLEKEWALLIEHKKKEFINEAQEIMRAGIREMERERLQIISKAKVEEKRIILEKRKQIFDEVRSESLEYAKSFIETDKYKELLRNDLQRARQEINISHELEIYLTKHDLERFEEEVYKVFTRAIKLYVDNEIIGGFVILDRGENAKFDMSILHRVNNAKDIIGEKLYELLQ